MRTPDPDLTVTSVDRVNPPPGPAPLSMMLLEVNPPSLHRPCHAPCHALPQLQLQLLTPPQLALYTQLEDSWLPLAPRLSDTELRQGKWRMGAAAFPLSDSPAWQDS